MNGNTWPKPPIHSRTDPPEIPEIIRIFGVEFAKKDEKPILNIPCNPIDKDEIRRLVRKSYSLFLKMMKTLDGSLLDRISNVHVQINEKINMGKVSQKEEPFLLAKNRKTLVQNKLLEDIQKIVANDQSDFDSTLNPL